MFSGGFNEKAPKLRLERAHLLPDGSPRELLFAGRLGKACGADDGEQPAKLLEAEFLEIVAGHGGGVD